MLVFKSRLPDSMNELWRRDVYSIVLLTKSVGPPLRLLADKIAAASPYDHCYFAPQDPVDPHTFLALYNNEPIGFLQVDKRNHDYTVSAKHARDGMHFWKKIPDEEIWSTLCIWIESEHQRKGIATALCVAASEFFRIPVQQFGWATPVSEAGQKLLIALEVDPVRLA